MFKKGKQLITLIWLLWLHLQQATAAPYQCTLVSGALVKLPHKPLFKYVSGSQKSNGNKIMSRTYFYIEDGNHKIYKIVVENLYYNYLSNAQAVINRDIGIIADFKRRYPLGSSVDVCGKVSWHSKISQIRFTHPSSCIKNNFNGFLHIHGEEITNSLEYCGNCACGIRY